jgi:hypothetical protein
MRKNVKILKQLVPFLFLLTLISCNKKLTESDNVLTPADVLFNQVKDDNDFLDYLNISYQTAQIFIGNAKKNSTQKDQVQRDSSYMADKTISLKEKFAKMQYDNYDEIVSLRQKQYNAYSNLQKKYPLWGKLSEAENKKFSSISVKYHKNKKIKK